MSKLRNATIYLHYSVYTHQAWCVGLMKALRDRSRIHLGAPRPSLPRNTRLWVEGDLASSSYLSSGGASTDILFQVSFRKITSQRCKSCGVKR